MYSVLVVDDEEVNRRIATLFLQRAGYEVQESSNGLKAWEKLQDNTFDLILLDISMPEMSGLELCRKIRDSDTLGKPAIVAYTAHAMAIEQQEILDAGFDGIITKPVSRAVLLETISQHLGRTDNAA